MLINPAFLLSHHVMMALTVATALSVVAAGISVGVIVGRETIFQTNLIVLQSPGSIILNRFIESYELPLYYDAIGTMNVFLASIKQVLTARFGAEFVNIELTYFSPTPTIASNDSQNSIIETKLVRRDIGANPPFFSQQQMPEGNTQTTTIGYDGYTTDVPCNNCTIFVSLPNCTYNSSSNVPGCINGTVSVHNCTCPQNSLLECINETVKVYNCTNRINDTINCGNAIITIPNHCSSGPNGNTPTKTSTVTISTTTTSTISNNSSNCEAPLDATGQTSIVSSKVLLYFAVKNVQSISVEDILATLKNVQPSIALYTACRQSSSQTSSFNSTLSNVQPPTAVNVDLTAIENQPSISTSLQQTVSAGAEAAQQQLLPSAATVASG